MWAMPEEHLRCFECAETGTDISRCEEQDIDGVINTAEMQTPHVRKWDSQGPTKLCARESTSMIEARSKASTRGSET